MRVLLCDDREAEPLMAIEHMSRRSVEDGGGEVVIAAHLGTARAALQSVATTKFDVVVIDLCLPVKFRNERPVPPSGPWLARAITRAHPELRAPLVMWTNNAGSTLDYRNQCQAFKHHGGRHIIDKVDSPENQLQTLEAALVGETWQPPSDGLTDTEREVLAYYAAGRRAPEIAQIMHRGTSAIESHITAIRHKLLPLPTADGTARGPGAVLAAAAAPDSNVSWLPIEHLAEPVGVFAEITKG